MANRKMRREQHIDNYTNSDINGIGSGIKLLIIIGVLFIAFYFITVIATNNINLSNNNDSSNNDSSESVIQYDKIVAGETFSEAAAEYYVLFYDSQANDASLYDNLVSNYEGKKALPIYVVDLNDGLNASYIGDNSNSSAQQSSDLKIKGSTLIKINNGQNILYLEGKDNIKAELD